MSQGEAWIGFTGPEQSLEVFGIRLVGITAESGRKLLLTLAVLLALYLFGRLLERLTRAGFSSEKHAHTRFWWRQGIGLNHKFFLPTYPPTS